MKRQLPEWKDKGLYKKVQTAGYTQNKKVKLDFARKQSLSLHSPPERKKTLWTDET